MSVATKRTRDGPDLNSGWTLQLFQSFRSPFSHSVLLARATPTLLVFESTVKF